MQPFDKPRANGGWAGFALLLAAIFLVFPASAQTFPPLGGRVVDAAKLLSPEQVAELTTLSAQVEQVSSRQLVVATIPDLQGYPIEDYGYRLGRAWKIGQKDANNGIILIVAPKERQMRIEVGYGLEPIMTDALSSQIVNDTIRPRFKAGDMAGGIIAGANAIAEQMKLPLEAAEQRAQQLAGAQQARHKQGGGIPFGLLFWLFIFALIILSRFRGGSSGLRHRSGVGEAILWGALLSGRGGGSSWGGGGGSDWGGGGDGGGFSGGGGSFGGGGASGSW